MAYTLFAEVEDGRSGSVDQRYQRTYKRVFLVGTDAATYGPYYAGSHSSLPAIWSAHNEDSLAYCVGFDVTQDQGDPKLWRVTANYAYNADTAQGGNGTGATGDPAIDTQQQGQAPGDRVQSPLSRPRDYQISSLTYPEALRGDISGNAILNSAYDYFSPAPEGQKLAATLTVGLNNSSAPSNTWLGSVGKINASSMTIGAYTFGAKTVRLNSLNAQLVYENGVSYWRWTLVWEYRPSSTSYAGGWQDLPGGSWPELGWQLVLLDVGKREWTGSKWQDFKDSPYTAPVSQPVNMNGAGGRLSAGGTPKYKAWDIYRTTTFPSPM
jgi:hypothetical protein